MSNIQDNETYRRVHFAVMAIENGAKNLGNSGKDMHDRLQKQGLIHNRLFKRYEELYTQSLQWVAFGLLDEIVNQQFRLTKETSLHYVETTFPKNVDLKFAGYRKKNNH